MYRNILFISRYLYSPTTKYHYIKSYIKVNYIFGILLLLPYLNSYKILTFILFLALSIEKNIVYKAIHKFNLNRIKFIVILIYYTILVDQLKHNRDKCSNRIQFTQLTIPYFLSIYSNSLKTKKTAMIYYLILLSINKAILRLIYIFFLSNNILSTFYLCTKYETVLEVIIGYFNIIKQKIKLNYKEYLMNLFLGYIFLEKFKLSLKDTNFSIKIKNIYLTSTQNNNLNILLKKYFSIFLTSQNNNSVILWNRNIHYKDFNNFQIYH